MFKKTYAAHFQERGMDRPVPAVRFEAGASVVATVTLSGYKVGAEADPAQWAVLFAAAPDMLAALQAALRAPGIQDTDQESGETFATLIQAAIDKALQ